MFCLLRPVADSCCNGTILRTAPAGAIPAVAVLGGPVRFQSGNREVTSIRSATPGLDEDHAPREVGRLQEAWVNRMRPGARYLCPETYGYWQNTF